MNAVEVRGLTHRFGSIDALDNVTLEIPAGSFVSIVGPSGCGKSTLLKVLAGLLVPTAGTATIGGVNAVGNPGLVGYMPQRDLLLPWKKAIDNACLGADLAGHDRRTSRANAHALFERFGLVGFEQAWPSQLSGGMRQRLALLRTYLTDARVLLLDEPFGALDAITRRDLQQWMQGLWVEASAGRSALFITHDVDEALYLADTVHVMSARPGNLTDTVTIDAPRPRHPALVTTPEFVTRKARLLNVLDANRPRTPEDPAAHTT